MLVHEGHMAIKAAEVANADRMMIRAAASDKGLEVSFADGRSRLIEFDEIPEIHEFSRLTGIELPNPYEIRLRNIEGETAELPWDFARHSATPAIDSGLKLPRQPAAKPSASESVTCASRMD